MAGTMLCGDEVNAAVVDVGTCVSRFGASGQDSPRHVFRSDIGVWNQQDGNRSTTTGESALRLFRENFEIQSFSSQKEYQKEDIETTLQYGISTSMQIDPTQYALLITQGKYFRDKLSQQQLCEVCFESLGSPALHIMPNSVLSGFSVGRPTALIIDMSASGTTITPIIDGYELKSGIVSSLNGGNTLDIAYEQQIEQLLHRNIPPWYQKALPTTSSSSSSISQLSSTIPVYTSSSSITYSTPLLTQILPSLSTSFQAYHRRIGVQDIKHLFAYLPTQSTALFPSENQTIDYLVSNGMGSVPSSYELPDGTVLEPSYTLCGEIVDRVYFPQSHTVSSISTDSLQISQTGQKRSRTLLQQDRQLQQLQQQQQQCILDKKMICFEEENLSDLIYLSLSKVDVDVRKELLSNLHFVGGCSLIKGVASRVSKELNEILPSQFKVKVVPALPLEKQHAAWIGGSIVSICGSFHQCWVSKEEYDEHGMNIVSRKCMN